MPAYIKVRAISRSQRIRIGNAVVPNTGSGVVVDLDNGKVRRDLQHHMAIGAVIPISTAVDANGLGTIITSGGVVDQGVSGADLALRVSAGTLRTVNGASVAIVAGTPSVSAADVTNPRIDNVVVTDATGVVTIVAGTAAAAPVAPAVAGGTTKLAEVAVPANDTAITDDQITNYSLSRYVIAT